MKYQTLWNFGKGFLMLTVASLVVYGYQPAPQHRQRDLRETSFVGAQPTMTAMFGRQATSGGTTSGGFQ